uniref:Alpha-carbonic anhydrase domain-containing protein n=1 Tax=Esox lucius TaxID=8010 RepID=A0A6Q2YUK3_ESOLU
INMYIFSIKLLCIFKQAFVLFPCSLEGSPSFWASLPNSQCGGVRQSPININPNQLRFDPSLRNLTFNNIKNPNIINVSVRHIVAGGGLSHLYTANVIHFHWGGDMWHPGSEHTVESVRYPMEQRFWAEHVILPINTFIGFQVSENSMHAEAWRHLTSYLLNVTQKASSIDIMQPLSISDLLDVDLTKFYRYHGSLTTPACEEVVVWTIFKEPIKIQRELVSDQRFPKTLKYGNTYRMVQKLNGRPVYGSQGMSVSPEGHVGNGYTFSSGALPSGLIPLSSLVMLGWE